MSHNFTSCQNPTSITRGTNSGDHRTRYLVIRLLLTLAALMALTTAESLSQEDHSQGAELRQMGGTWKFARLDTAKHSKNIADAWEGTVLVIKDRELTFNDGVRRANYTIQLNPDSPVKKFNLIPVDAKSRNRATFLYEVDRDTLRLSYLPHAVPNRLEQGVIVVFERSSEGH